MSASASSRGRPSARFSSRCGRRWRSILPDGAAADAVVNETDSGVDLLLRPHKRLDLSLERREALVALAERARPRAAELGRSRDGRARRRAPPAASLFGEARVEPPPGAFLQATKRAEQAMRAAVARMDRRCAAACRSVCRRGRAVAWPAGKVALFESDKPTLLRPKRRHAGSAGR